ncbi:MAG: hypothetical protein WB783_00570, partial [Arenicellales bacterium]
MFTPVWPCVVGRFPALVCFLLLFLAVFFLVVVPVEANPTGGRVVSGTGVIVHTSSSRLDVKQGSERLGVEWEDFSIGAGEQVNFDQPSRSAIALNR